MTITPPPPEPIDRAQRAQLAALRRHVALAAQVGSLLDAARAAASQAFAPLHRLKAIAQAAMRPDLEPAERAQQQALYDAEIAALRELPRQATVGRQNLLVSDDLGGPGDSVKGLGFSGRMTVAGGDWRLGRPTSIGLAVSENDRLDTPEQAARVADRADTTISWLNTELRRLEHTAQSAANACASAIAAANAAPGPELPIVELRSYSVMHVATDIKHALATSDLAIANCAPRLLLPLFRPPPPA